MSILHLNPKDFNTPHVLKDKVLVVFYAEWCPFCRKFIPLCIDKEKTAGIPLKAATLNEDDNPLWEKFNIKAVPTLIAFKDSKPIARRDARAGIGLDKTDLDSILAEIV